jgi:uncharacterized protein YjcR
MTWNECLAMGATRLAACLGCPVTTAHSWIRRSGPAEWLQPILAAHVTHQMKMHNKASLATDTSREAGSRKRKS